MTKTTDFRALLADDAYAVSFQSLGQYRTALLKALDATPPPEPPTEQKNWIDELIAKCKPLDPEMAEVLTTEVRWRLYGEGDSATPPPEPPTDEEIKRFAEVFELFDEIVLIRAALERWGK